MSQIAPQINYKPESQSANPKYRFLRVPLNNLTGSSFTLTATSSQVIEFKLPNAVYNLSQSFIQYEVAMASQGAGNYGWAYADTLDLATNAYFGTAGGLDLCNLNYVNRYVKIARKMKTRFSEMMANDTTSQLRPCLTTAPSNYYPVTGVSANIGTAGFVETQYLEPPSAAATAKSYYRQFPLKGIVDTIFALDKDLYIPTDMYVRFTAGTGNQIVFLSSDATAPPTGAGSVAGNITINSCYLWLAV